MIPGVELQQTPYTAVMLVAAAFAAPVAGYAWRNRDVPGGRALAVLMAAAAFWAAATAGLLAVESLAGKVLFNKLTYLGVTATPVAWLAFASAYTGHDEYLTRRSLLVASAVPALTLALVWTNEYHRLVWTDNRVVTATVLGATFADLQATHATTFWAWAAYAYALILAGTALFARTLYAAEGIYRGQALALLVAVLVPWTANAASLFDLVPALDVTPLGFVVSGLALSAAVYRHRLLEVVPVAREAGRDEVIASMDDAVVILNRNDRVIDCNPAAEELLECPAREAVGRPLPAVLEALASAVDGEWTGRTEVVLDHGDEGDEGGERDEGDGGGDGGAKRHYDVRVSAMDGHDLLGGRVVTMRDVTDRERRRRELERYDRILNTVGDVVYAVDTEGTIVEVNDAAVEVTGYDRDELLGTHVSALMDERDYRRGAERVRELLADDERTDTTFEMDLVTQSGERVRCENHVGLLPEEGGRHEGSVGILRDVTDRRQRVQQIDVLNRVLRHDLRNDVNVILGNAELLRSDPADPERHLAEITTQAEEMIDLSNKVRRIERTLDAAGEGPLDVRDLVAGRVERLAGEHPEATVETDLQRATARASDLVAFAVDDAVENAVEHNDGDPHVEVRTRDDPANDRVTVEVRDDGPGIPETEREILGRERETQLEHASGIGLWLINWAVAQAGGTVEFEENEPRGSVVRIHLPRAEPTEGAGRAERSGDPGGTGHGRSTDDTRSTAGR